MAHRRNDKADMMTKPANGPAVAAAPAAWLLRRREVID